MKRAIIFMSTALALLTVIGISMIPRFGICHNSINDEALVPNQELRSSIHNQSLRVSHYITPNEFLDLDTTIFAGETEHSFFGFSVSNAGDVNGDGYSDLISGAREFGSGKGRAYIYFGGTNIDNVPDVILTGEAVGNYFGYSVSTAGDVNGDGYADVLVGAYGHNAQTGKAYVFFGGQFMDNVPDITMTGESSSNEFGISVSDAGDVNGDGYSDFIVGAHAIFSRRGKAYLYFGNSQPNGIADVVMGNYSPGDEFGVSVSSAGDVNNDGFADVIIGAEGTSTSRGTIYIFLGSSDMNAVPDLMILGEASNNEFGHSVSCAGDVNSDGFDDVIVSALLYQVGGNYVGRTYLFLGNVLMDTIPDFKVTGNPDNRLGPAVSNAGDVNGDGFGDIVIGSYRMQQDKGSVSIYYGGESIDSIADLTINGITTADRYGTSVSSAGDVDGDGYSDIFIGADGRDNQRGFAYLYSNLQPKPELVEPLNNSLNNPATINFEWRRWEPAQKYLLVISKDSLFNTYVLKDTIYADTSKIVSGLEKETKYFWNVTAIDSIGGFRYSSTWKFTVEPPLKVALKIAVEGLYYPLFNQMSRKDSLKVYLCESTAPFVKRDSAYSIIDSLSLIGLFKFFNASPGNYYLVTNHFQSVETWSRAGGEQLTNNGMFANYDFTSSASKAYGNNLKFKGRKYCIISGDVSQDGFIDGSDFLVIDNDAYNFASERFLPSDLNGDGFADALDMQIGDNNRSREVIRP